MLVESSAPVRGALVDPALELGNRDEDHLRAAADHPELRLDVLVEEVAADAEHRCGFVWHHRDPTETALRPLLRLGRWSGGEIEPELLPLHLGNISDPIDVRNPSA
jgi:hypothetical protein